MYFMIICNTLVADNNFTHLTKEVLCLSVHFTLYICKILVRFRFGYFVSINFALFLTDI